MAARPRPWRVPDRLWAEVEPLLPKDHLLVELRLGEEPLDRTVTFTPTGPGWESRMQTMHILASELFPHEPQVDPRYVDLGGRIHDGEAG